MVNKRKPLTIDGVSVCPCVSYIVVWKLMYELGKQLYLSSYKIVLITVEIIYCSKTIFVLNASITKYQNLLKNIVSNLIIG